MLEYLPRHADVTDWHSRTKPLLATAFQLWLQNTNLNLSEALNNLSMFINFLDTRFFWENSTLANRTARCSLRACGD